MCVCSLAWATLNVSVVSLRSSLATIPIPSDRSAIDRRSKVVWENAFSAGKTDNRSIDNRNALYSRLSNLIGAIPQYSFCSQFRSVCSSRHSLLYGACLICSSGYVTSTFRYYAEAETTPGHLPPVQHSSLPTVRYPLRFAADSS